MISVMKLNVYIGMFEQIICNIYIYNIVSTYHTDFLMDLKSVRPPVKPN